jgi:hypothetical protein
MHSGRRQPGGQRCLLPLAQRRLSQQQRPRQQLPQHLLAQPLLRPASLGHLRRSRAWMCNSCWPACLQGGSRETPFRCPAQQRLQQERRPEQKKGLLVLLRPPSPQRQKQQCRRQQRRRQHQLRAWLASS